RCRRVTRHECAQFAGPLSAQESATQSLAPRFDREIPAIQPLLHRVAGQQVARIAEFDLCGVNGILWQRIAFHLLASATREPLLGLDLELRELTPERGRDKDIAARVRPGADGKQGETEKIAHGVKSHLPESIRSRYHLASSPTVRTRTRCRGSDR